MDDDRNEAVRREIADMDFDNAALLVGQWLGEHLPKFEAMGVDRDAITAALMAVAVDRMLELPDRAAAVEWLDQAVTALAEFPKPGRA